MIEEVKHLNLLLLIRNNNKKKTSKILLIFFINMGIWISLRISRLISRILKLMNMIFYQIFTFPL